MNEMMVFNNPEFGSVRTVCINGEPWLVGKDVAEILGYKETAKAIRTHVDNDDKGVSILDTPGGKQQYIVINESGFYSLVLSSKLPTAKKFKRWVTAEVLPTIRKTGGYVANEDVFVPPCGEATQQRPPAPDAYKRQWLAYCVSKRPYQTLGKAMAAGQLQQSIFA